MSSADVEPVERRAELYEEAAEKLEDAAEAVRAGAGDEADDRHIEAAELVAEAREVTSDD